MIPSRHPTVIDTENALSARSGWKGQAENGLRRYRTLVHALTMLPLYAMGTVAMGLALTPGAWLVLQALQSRSALLPLWLAFAVGAGYFLYCFSIITILPAFNFLLRARLKPWRGPYYSLESIPWYIHNGLTYLARFTCLSLLTPTPFNVLFYRAMGMKIGRNVQINSVNISDPSLIELGDSVTIGGSATLLAHYGVRGFLILAPLKIGARATIGLHAKVMGGVEIGEGAVIMPNSVVLPKTVVPAGETWGGVPAQKIDLKRHLRAARPVPKTG